MAAPHFRYKKDSLEWTPTGGSAIPITGVTALRYGKGGDTVDLMSDASEMVQEQPLSGIKGRISVSTINQLHTGLDLGAGELVFKLERVKSGRGAVSGDDQDVTFGNAVLKDTDGGAGTSAGEGTSLTFDAAEDGSGEIYTVADAV